MILKLGTTNVYPKRKKHDILGAVAMTTLAAGAVLIKTEIPSFFLNQELSTPPNLMLGVRTLWEVCLFQVRPFVSLPGLQMVNCKWPIEFPGKHETAPSHASSSSATPPPTISACAPFVIEMRLCHYCSLVN